MATKPISPAMVSFVPKNLRDAAYQAAHAGQSLRQCALFVRDTQPDVLEKGLTDANKTELYSGWQLKYREDHADQRFVIRENRLMPLADNVADQEGMVVFNVDVAMMLTQQAFSKLKSEDPDRHAVIGKIRTKFQGYCSNRWNDMLHIIKETDAEGKPKKGRRVLDFTAKLAEVFENLKTERKNKQAKGDTTVPSAEVFQSAIDAFYDKMK